MGGRGHADKFVHKFINRFLNKGHSLYVDNYYSSVDLCYNLLDKKTYMTGRLRNLRKGNPQEIDNKELKPGESIYKFMDRGVCALKCYDKQEVLPVCSEFGLGDLDEGV